MVVRGGICHIINVRKSPYDIITAVSLRSKYYKKGLNHFVFNFLKNDPRSDLFFFYFFHMRPDGNQQQPHRLINGSWLRKTLCLEFPDNAWRRRWGSAGGEPPSKCKVIVSFYQCPADSNIQQSAWKARRNCTTFQVLWRFPKHFQLSVNLSRLRFHLISCKASQNLYRQLKFSSSSSSSSSHLLLFLFLFPGSPSSSCCCSSSIPCCHNSVWQPTDRPVTDLPPRRRVPARRPTI